MASINKVLCPWTALGNAAALLYAPATPMQATIMAFKLDNIDAANHAVTIYGVPPGGSVLNANKWWGGITIAANTLYESYSPNDYGLYIIPPGGSVWGFADTAAMVNVYFHGLEGTPLTVGSLPGVT